MTLSFRKLSHRNSTQKLKRANVKLVQTMNFLSHYSEEYNFNSLYEIYIRLSKRDLDLENKTSTSNRYNTNPYHTKKKEKLDNPQETSTFALRLEKELQKKKSIILDTITEDPDEDFTYRLLRREIDMFQITGYKGVVLKDLPE